MRSDEDYGGIVLAQAHAVVPRVQTGSVAPALALTLVGQVHTQVTQLFSSTGERDTFSDTQFQLAQEMDPLILP